MSRKNKVADQPVALGGGTVLAVGHGQRIRLYSYAYCGGVVVWRYGTVALWHCVALELSKATLAESA